jgi:hypothetical protein
MRTLLARLVLVCASLPAFGADAEIEALVMDGSATEESHAIERRLARRLQTCVLPIMRNGEELKGDLVVNVRVAPDGSLRVVNAHGGNRAMRNAVNRKLNGSHVG